jgi:hypothetical protein
MQTTTNGGATCASFSTGYAYQRHIGCEAAQQPRPRRQALACPAPALTALRYRQRHGEPSSAGCQPPAPIRSARPAAAYPPGLPCVPYPGSRDELPLIGHVSKTQRATTPRRGRGRRPQPVAPHRTNRPPRSTGHSPARRKRHNGSLRDLPPPPDRPRRTAHPTARPPYCDHPADLHEHQRIRSIPSR